MPHWQGEGGTLWLTFVSLVQTTATVRIVMKALPSWISGILIGSPVTGNSECDGAVKVVPDITLRVMLM